MSYESMRNEKDVRLLVGELRKNLEYAKSFRENYRTIQNDPQQLEHQKTAARHMVGYFQGQIDVLVGVLELITEDIWEDYFKEDDNERRAA